MIKGLKKAIINVAELKRKTYTFSTEFNGWTTGTGTWLGATNMLSNIGTGVTSADREGDEIYLVSIDMKVSTWRPIDRQNGVFRFALIKSDYDYIPTLGAAGAGPIMRSNTGGRTVLCSSIDEERYDIVKEWYVNPGDLNLVNTTAATAPAGPTVYTQYVRVPVNRKIHYKEATKMSGANCYSLLMTLSDQRGVLTDVIGNAVVEISLYFKDV
jgi:hypothetical protein